MGNPKLDPTENGKALHITLEGSYYAWSGAGPVMIMMGDEEKLFVPCFSSTKLLRTFLEREGIEWESIEEVENSAEFMDTVIENGGPNVRVIFDLQYLEDGGVYFAELCSTLN